MEDLIEQLEAATWPNRALDEEIAFKAGWRVMSRDITNVNGATETVTAWIGPDDNIEEVWENIKLEFSINGPLSEQEPPRYTGSLDAALTLIPDGFYWEVSHGTKIGKYGPYWATVYSVEMIKYMIDTDPEIPGCTPAIALCIAALSLPSSKEREG